MSVSDFSDRPMRPVPSHDTAKPWDEEWNQPTPSVAKVEPSFVRVLWTWEKLRVLYNALMSMIFFLLVVRFAWDIGAIPSAESVCYWALVFLAVVNVPFCFCHAAEIYLCAMHAPRLLARIAIFTIITCLCGGPFLALLFAK